MSSHSRRPGHGRPRLGDRCRRGGVVLAISAVLASLAVAVAPSASAAPGVFLVTSTGDQIDATIRANCANGASPCTLRAAIAEANDRPNDAGSPDRIEFALDGPAPQTISVASSLPQITDAVTLDAGLPPVGAPRAVELTGADCFSTTSVACDGLVIRASGTTVR